MAAADPPLLDEALRATRESRRIEFKREFSGAAPGAWCELLKDVAAMANSGGGVIIFGLNNDGSPSGWDPTAFLATDMADATNTFAKYVSEQFDDFEIHEVKKGRRSLAAVVVQPRTGTPLVFEKPGTYSDGEQRQKTAFARGTVYFRHGAKSEPGSARDISRFVNREVARQRRDWLKNIRKVAAAPKGAEILVVSAKPDPSSSFTNVRVVDDPNAPAIARTDFDVTHPYRLKELVSAFNSGVGKRVATTYDVQCVRRVHSIDAQSKFFHKPKFGWPQYSDALVSWLLDQYRRNPDFFGEARLKAKAVLS